MVGDPTGGPLSPPLPRNKRQRSLYPTTSTMSDPQSRQVSSQSLQPTSSTISAKLMRMVRILQLHWRIVRNSTLNQGCQHSRCTSQRQSHRPIFLHLLTLLLIPRSKEKGQPPGPRHQCASKVHTSFILHLRGHLCGLWLIHLTLSTTATEGEDPLFLTTGMTDPLIHCTLTRTSVEIKTAL